LKNQNDLIVAGAVVLVAIGVSLGFMFTKREPVEAPAVPTVVVSDPQPTSATVAMSDSLPGAGAGGARAGGRAGGRGGIAGVGGGATFAGAASGAGPAAATPR